MQTAIHPIMHADAKTTCTTCQAVYLIPSTVKEQTVEACKACHPQYTGKKQTNTKGGRIERFRKIQAASHESVPVGGGQRQSVVPEIAQSSPG